MCPAEHPCPPTEATAPASASAGTIALRAVVGFGLLPAVSPGLALSADVAVFRWIHGSAGVLYLPEQPWQNGGFAFGMTAAWLGACAQPWESHRVTLSLCAQAMAGGIHSVVLVPEPVHPGERAWGAASLEAVLRMRLLGPLEAEVGADVVFPFTRYPFVVEGSPQSFQQPQATGVAFVGAGASFR